ncbi:MAG: AraC family transcriptional regulator ligand-binding domain-containing protein [Polyangiaceae bacterium]
MVKRVHALAQKKGLGADRLARASGIDPAALGDPDARIEVSASDAFVEALDGALGPDVATLGVELAFTRDLETYDAAGLVMLAAPTLRAGFDRAFAVQSLWGDGDRFRRERDRIFFAPAPPGSAHRRAHEIVTECALVEIGLASRFVSPDAPPLGVTLAYDATPRRAALEGVLGAPVTWGAGRSSVLLGASALDAPMPEAALLTIGIHPGASFRDRVRAATARGTILGDASLVTVADALGVPARTLQRRLAEEGEAFGSIVEGERTRLSHAWLRAGLSIAEVGALLGYADKAAFYRAFRRWTGTTPHEARTRMPERTVR